MVVLLRKSGTIQAATRRVFTLGFGTDSPALRYASVQACCATSTSRTASEPLLAKGWKLLTDTLGRVAEIDIGGFKVVLRETDPHWKDNWQQHGDRFLGQIRKQESSVLLIVDELPDMLFNLKRENPALLREFLAWFRAQRQNPHLSEDRARWLIGGSVNLSGTLDALGLVDLINDLEDLSLPIILRMPKLSGSYN